jgi:hypothetical protein
MFMSLNPLPRLYSIQVKVEQMLMEARGNLPETTVADLGALAEEIRELIADMNSGNDS